MKIKKLWVLGMPAKTEVIGLIGAEMVILARGEGAHACLQNAAVTPHVSFNLAAEESVEQWVDDLLASIAADTTLAYLTSIAQPHNDLVALNLMHRAIDIEMQIYPGESAKTDFTPWMTAGQPLLTLDGLLLQHRHHPPFSGDHNVLIHEPCSAKSPRELRILLESVYVAAQPLAVALLSAQGETIWQAQCVAEVEGWQSSPSAIFIPACAGDQSLESFQEIIAHLRAPQDGCPWDKKQTHASLRTYLLEETYEALDALDKGDLNALKEELGDILLQILLHSQIALEAGEFTLADVLSGIHRKIVHRHPHVFKDWQVRGEEDVIQNWESIKGQERRENGRTDHKGMLDGVPLSAPSLAQAQSIQERAARVGFDWPELAPVMDKVIEELQEVKDAPDAVEREKEIGDLLFAMVNLIRWYKIDAETALRQTNLKFRKRFAFIEEQAQRMGKGLQSMTLAEMDVLWEQAKQFDL